MAELTIDSLGRFLDAVHLERERLRLDHRKELWFRGESRDYQGTLLRPELYRPRKSNALRQIEELLDIESELHEEFKRCAEQFRSEALDREYWEWDSYFLLQHHGGATRLLDWSDGALMALHFAIRNAHEDGESHAFVYITEPDGLNQRLNAIHRDNSIADRWRDYVRSKPSGYGLDEDDWQDAYLPSDKSERAEFAIPSSPMVLNFPHITRRVAAQRSRFVVFGTEVEFLANEFKREDPLITRLCIDGRARCSLRRELRDSGVTESVIYPDFDGLGREIKQLWEERK